MTTGVPRLTRSAPRSNDGERSVKGGGLRSAPARGGRLLGDSQETWRTQAGAADQAAVDLGYLHEGREIVGRYAPAVENPYVVGGRPVKAAELRPEGSHRGVRPLGRRWPTRADRPDWLVGQDDAFHRRHVGETEAKLAGDHGGGLAGLVLDQRLAYAQDRLQPVGQRGEYLAIDRLVGLAEDVAS